MGGMNGSVLDGLVYYVRSSLIQIRSEKMGNFILYLRKYAEKVAQEEIEDERKNSIVLRPYKSFRPEELHSYIGST